MEDLQKVQMKEAEEGWCRGGETGGWSGPPGDHPSRCPKCWLLPRVPPLAVTGERLASFGILWHGQ